jgi:hypothetical protein
MKTIFTIAAVAALAGTAFGQLNPLPPSSTVDGVTPSSIGPNAGITHWDNPATIGAYKPVALTEGTAPITTPTYNPLGVPFSTSIPAIIQMNLNTIAAQGGTVRTIFLAESAGWRDSLGYTRSGNPAGPQSYTVFANFEDNAASGGKNISFGDHFDVTLPVGAANTFDIWFQGAGTSGPSDPNPASQYGGVYTLFRPSASNPNIAPNNAMWAQQALLVNTWVPARNSYADVATYVVGLEDWRLDRGSDRDYSDAVIAFQFYSANGTPFTPVPEPSTYTLIGAASLLSLAAWRRYRRKSQTQAGPAAFAS